MARAATALRAVELMKHRLGFSTRAASPRTALPLCHHQRRRPAQVIPSLASVWYFFREIDFENIKKNYESGTGSRRPPRMMTNTNGSPASWSAPPRRATFKQDDRRVCRGKYPIASACGLELRGADLLPRRWQKVSDGNQDGLATRCRGLRRRSRIPRAAAPPTSANVLLGGARPRRCSIPPTSRTWPGPQLANAIRDGNADRHQGVIAAPKVMALSMVDFSPDQKL